MGYTFLVFDVSALTLIKPARSSRLQPFTGGSQIEKHLALMAPGRGPVRPAALPFKTGLRTIAFATSQKRAAQFRIDVRSVVFAWGKAQKRENPFMCGHAGSKCAAHGVNII